MPMPGTESATYYECQHIRLQLVRGAIAASPPNTKSPASRRAFHCLFSATVILKCSEVEGPARTRL